MAGAEHPAEPQLDQPADGRIDGRTAGELKLDMVGKARHYAEVFKLVPVNPPREGTARLLVHEKPVNS